MSHCIHAIATRAQLDPSAVESFGLETRSLPQSVTLIALDAEQVDALADRFDHHGPIAADPQLNFASVHRLMAALTPGEPFAILETDYFGGTGTQAAAVYLDGKELLAPRRAALGPINEALLQLGVQPSAGQDAFDTIGLGGLRRWE